MCVSFFFKGDLSLKAKMKYSGLASLMIAIDTLMHPTNNAFILVWEHSIFACCKLWPYQSAEAVTGMEL